ncbi:MAG: hypothetical protein AVDCRST_MAG19-4359, partial [uncultured Thermomicrobiales bacterium]
AARGCSRTRPDAAGAWPGAPRRRRTDSGPGGTPPARGKGYRPAIPAARVHGRTGPTRGTCEGFRRGRPLSWGPSRSPRSMPPRASRRRRADATPGHDHTTVCSPSDAVASEGGPVGPARRPSHRNARGRRRRAQPPGFHMAGARRRRASRTTSARSGASDRSASSRRASPRTRGMGWRSRPNTSRPAASPSTTERESPPHRRPDRGRVADIRILVRKGGAPGFPSRSAGVAARRVGIRPTPWRASPGGRHRPWADRRRRGPRARGPLPATIPRTTRAATLPLRPCWGERRSCHRRRAGDRGRRLGRAHERRV